ncbi:MAG: alpha/beta fold hydrolase [Actinomycetes bacterium]
MPKVSRGSVDISYADTGGDGRAIAFSHGILMDASTFDAQIAEFSSSYRCITWDQRGHGETGLVTDPFTYWDSANDLIAILDEAGVDDAVLVGMSQGGFLSLRAALTAPERVRALVFIDTQAGLEAEDAAPLYTQMAENWAANGYDEGVAAFVADLILGASVDATPWLEKWRNLPKEQVLQPTYTLVRRDDLTDRLREVRQPALVIHGTADKSIPMVRAQQLADGLPNCTGLVDIPDAGHASNVSHPKQVNEAIAAFLSTLD